MPIFWRYLFREFLKLFTLSTLGLIACLLLTRLQEIAYFASLSGSFSLTFLFTLYQIPYILPFAIPIGSLLSSTILFQRLSASHELTALRSAGLSLKQIKEPLKFLSFFLALATFLIVSELTPITRHASYLLVQNLIASNPLLILKKNKQLPIKDSYLEIESLLFRKEAHHILLVLHQNSHLSLLTIDSLALKNQELIAETMTYITPLSDHDLMIETEKNFSIDGSALTSLVIPPSLSEKTDHCPFKPLIEKIFMNPSLSEKAYNRGLYELFRRFFFPLLTITFMLLGMSYGCHIGRKNSSQALNIMLLATYAFLCFLSSKSQHKHPELAALLMLILPHFPLIYLAKKAEKRLDLGLE